MGLENPLHIAVLVVLLLLVFGAKRLPEMGRSIGTGMREFKDSVSGSTPALTQGTPAQAQPQPVAAQAPTVAQAPVATPPPAAVPPAPVAQPVEAPGEPTRQA